MLLGLSHGEILLIAFIFALVYGAGHLPWVAAKLGGKPLKVRQRDPSED